MINEYSVYFSKTMLILGRGLMSCGPALKWSRALYLNFSSGLTPLRARAYVFSFKAADSNEGLDNGF